jgi:hypothetical protein
MRGYSLHLLAEQHDVVAVLHLLVPVLTQSRSTVHNPYTHTAEQLSRRIHIPPIVLLLAPLEYTYRQVDNLPVLGVNVDLLPVDDAGLDGVHDLS